MLKNLKTYFCLGFLNILRVAIYRITLKIRLHPVQYIKSSIASAPFFRISERQGEIPPEIKDWDNSIYLFGWYKKKIENKIPDWFTNLFSNNHFTNFYKNWWHIPDFENDDIKCIWELSRFNWAVGFSTKIANGDTLSLSKLNIWLENWSKLNPPYKGPNWKCSQECSIRVINLLTAARVLGQDQNPESGLIDIIKTHLKRIEKTLSYAIAQQNNHATSEATALFMGGNFLLNHEKRAKKWEMKGRRLLEDHAINLIEPDGTFSQYSTNYHRVMLDTYSIAEAWRRSRNLKSFSNNLNNKLKLATEWLWTFTDFDSGEVPIIGANDGSKILQLSRCDYKDYRPSIQLAAALFMNVDAFGDGLWNETLSWFGVPRGEFSKTIGSKTYIYGGYHVLRKKESMAILNYPKFRFRPSQADALHVDLWKNGKNLLRDGGTFSYNSKMSNWYSSTAAHNTIEFDKQNQMHKISKFLFADWLKTKEINLVKNYENCLVASAAYKDNFMNTHKREIILTENTFICNDKIDGNFKEACLRWRLIPEQWQIKDKILRNLNYSISIEINGKLITPTIDKTFESDYYYKQNEVPMIYIKVDKPSILVTKFTF